MSRNDSAVDAVFAVQRSAIQRTHEAVVAGVEFQRDVSREFGTDLELARDLNEFEGDLVTSGADAVFGNLAEATGDTQGLAEAFESVRDSIVELEENETEVIADAIDSLENGLQDGSDSVEDALADLLDGLDDTTERLLETNEEAADALEDLRDNVEELQEQAEDAADDLADEDVA
jgi:uncharacterized phage infection (PIP) family protein YhgE